MTKSIGCVSGHSWRASSLLRNVSSWIITCLRNWNCTLSLASCLFVFASQLQLVLLNNHVAPLAWWSVAISFSLHICMFKKRPKCYRCSTLDRRVSTASSGLLAQHLLYQLVGHQHAVLALGGHPLWCQSWTSGSKFIQGTQWIQSAECLRRDLAITTEFGKRL